MTALTVSVFDTKPYDREYFARAEGAGRLAWRFHNFHLCAQTAPAADGAQAVCAFVNDEVDRSCLEILASFGVNVLITAHQGFLTHEALSEIARVTTTNLLRLETSEPFLPGTELPTEPEATHES